MTPDRRRLPRTEAGRRAVAKALARRQAATDDRAAQLARGLALVRAQLRRGASS